MRVVVLVDRVVYGIHVTLLLLVRMVMTAPILSLLLYVCGYVDVASVDTNDCRINVVDADACVVGCVIMFDDTVVVEYTAVAVAGVGFVAVFVVYVDICGVYDGCIVGIVVVICYVTVVGVVI